MVTIWTEHTCRSDAAAAVRAYEQALRTLDPHDDRHGLLLDQVDPADIAAACRARLVSARGQSLTGP